MFLTIQNGHNIQEKRQLSPLGTDAQRKRFARSLCETMQHRQFRLLYYSILTALLLCWFAAMLGITQAYGDEYSELMPILIGLSLVLFVLAQLVNFIALKKDMADHHAAELLLHQSRQAAEAALRREQERHHLSETLREVALIVSSSLDQDRVVDLILGQLESVIPYHRATVSLLSGNMLTLVAGRDMMGGDIDSYSFPAYKYPINAQALANKLPVLIQDVTQDVRWHETASMSGIRSFITAPLLAQNEPIGTLAVGRIDAIPYAEEDAQTVFAFASQVAMAMRNAQLHEELRQRMELEISTARSIQKSLLAFKPPQIRGLDIAGFCEPAREVGGDFYNFSVMDEQHLGIAVGDVSGKGIHAALMMALSFGFLSTESRYILTPSALMDTMNAELRPHSQHNTMNTALGYLSLSQNGDRHEGAWHVRAANAGLIAPLIRRRTGDVEWLDVCGLPLGMVDNLTYSEQSYQLYPGDAILLTTDGVVEAMNAAGEMFGLEQFSESIAHADCQTAQSLLQAILSRMNAFIGGAETHDDVTMVVVMVKNP